MNKSSLVFVSVLAVVLAKPFTNSDGSAVYDIENGPYFEGDIILVPGQKNGLVDERYRWPNGVVPYVFGEDWDDKNDKSMVFNAMEEYKTKTNGCIQFVERTDETNYVSFQTLNAGCYSYVGRIGGVQEINYQNSFSGTCFIHGTIMHEMLHALGFHHQQSATERDDYVTIMWDNIQSGKEHNFDKYDDTVVTNFDVTYDYGSVMHYGRTAFSKNGLDTIVPLDPTAEIGQREDISDSDLKKLMAMYGCSK